MNPSKILLTGGTGFIGSRLCERLALDYKLPYRVLVRNFTHAPRIARLGAEMVGGDLDDSGSLDRALVGCDTVVHLAYSEGPQTRTLVRACRKAGIKRLVHISSIAVHGADPGPEAAHEATARIGRYPGQEYSNLKAQAELVIQHAIGDGLPAVILRPTIVYGPYGPFVISIVEAARDRGVFTMLDEGRGICNAVYVDDVCDAILTAIESNEGIGSAFFITADNAVTWREFQSRLRANGGAGAAHHQPQLGRSPAVLGVPAADVQERHRGAQSTRYVSRVPPAPLLGGHVPYPHHGREATRDECSTARSSDCVEGSQGGTAYA